MREKPSIAPEGRAQVVGHRVAKRFELVYGGLQLDGPLADALFEPLVERPHLALGLDLGTVEAGVLHGDPDLRGHRLGQLDLLRCDRGAV